MTIDPPIGHPRHANPHGQSIVNHLRIGDVLVNQGVITSDQLSEVLATQESASGNTRRRLGALLVETKMATEQQIALALGTALKLEVVDLTQHEIIEETARLLPRPVAERHEILVLDRDDSQVTVATSDPTNVVAIDDVKLYTGTNVVRIKIATSGQLREVLSRIWSLASDSASIAYLVDDIDDDTPSESDLENAGVNDAPIVRLVNAVLADAVRSRASDIHLEPQRGDLRIRYRIDGVLREVMKVPRGAISSVISRIKIMSGLDISERRRPQDGRTKLNIDGLRIDVRVSTLPIMHGEKVVLRLLAKASDIPHLGESGFDDEQLVHIRRALESPQGLVVICGPTGSGKTSTLYAGINEVSRPECNVVTLEDPVEIQLPGINQVQVNVKAGMTFAAGLRSVLRQDPDVVLVGEVRDGETARLALEASLTGHLVLTTLHTNGAIEAITRLIDMGIEPFLVASSLTLVVAQRLVRKPCSSCSAPYIPDTETLFKLDLTLSDLAGSNLVRGMGCSDCNNSGYRGRTGIFEILPIDSNLRQVLLNGASEAMLQNVAREMGVKTLRGDAIARAMRGITTLEEALRVTHSDHVVVHRCPGCDKHIEGTMKGCPWCGHDLVGKLCRSCGTKLEDEWGFCPQCRTSTTEYDPLTSPIAPSSQAPKAPELPSAPLTDMWYLMPGEPPPSPPGF